MPRRGKNLVRSLLLRLGIVAVVVLLSGLICATLVRFAPGFGVDERELDPRLANESVRALRSLHGNQRNVASFYADYVKRSMHGDLGASQLFSQPIAALVKQRAPTTACNILYGLVMAWALGLVLAVCAILLQNPVADCFISSGAGTLISIPAGIVALSVVILKAPAFLAVGITLLPMLYRYSRSILQRAWVAPWMTAARAKGLGSAHLLFRHALPVAAPQLIALGGVSINMAFSASLPVEVVADAPGIGQLAWQAALGRDLPLLVTLTALITTTTLMASAIASVLNEANQPGEA
jgi:peptide/nickel transport system permease protein